MILRLAGLLIHNHKSLHILFQFHPPHPPQFPKQNKSNHVPALRDEGRERARVAGQVRPLLVLGSNDGHPGGPVHYEVVGVDGLFCV